MLNVRGRSKHGWCVLLAILTVLPGAGAASLATDPIPGDADPSLTSLPEDVASYAVDQAEAWNAAVENVILSIIAEACAGITAINEAGLDSVGWAAFDHDGIVRSVARNAFTVFFGPQERGIVFDERVDPALDARWANARAAAARSLAVAMSPLCP